MKTHAIILLGLGLLAAGTPAALPAQDVGPAAASARLTPDQLDELLGPIALYPDALVALILPAAASPSDIVLAARYLQSGYDPAQVDSQSWDDSVVALAHYPDVIQWMNQNLAWTQQLGEVFVAQPTDVMQSVQRLRAEARAAGTLTDTPQQQVVVDDDYIEIVPAQPNVIYVPRYDPDIVYGPPPGYYAGSYITFGVGFSTGLWLTHDLDWGHHRIWVADRQDHNPRDWRHPVFPGRPGYVRDPSRHPWNPPARLPSPRPATPPGPSRPPQVTRPAFIAGTPPPPPGWQRRDGPGRRPDNPPRVAAPTAAPAPPGGRSPVVAPMQGPVVQPFQQPLVQPFRPPSATPAPPVPTERRENVDVQRERERLDREREDRARAAQAPQAPQRGQPPPPPRNNNNNKDDDDRRRDGDRDRDH